jgi:hypothetical protein
VLQKVSDALGGGSMTALIIETQAVMFQLIQLT